MADILHFPRIPEKYSGQLIDWMIEASDSLRGKPKHEREFQCSTCTREFKESDKITSDILHDSLFCSPECRNEAEQAAEDTRRTDIRPGSY